MKVEMESSKRAKIEIKLEILNLGSQIKTPKKTSPTYHKTWKREFPIFKLEEVDRSVKKIFFF